MNSLSLVTAGLLQGTSSSMLTTIDVLSVQCLELLSSIFLHSSSGSSALSPALHDTVLQMCQIDRIVRLQCELMSNRSNELNEMLSINAANHVMTQSLQQEAVIDMPVSDEHETNSATTLASTSTRRSDVDGGGGDDMSLLFSDKISVIKASLSCDHNILVSIHPFIHS